MEKFYYADTQAVMSQEEIRAAVLESLKEWKAQHGTLNFALIIPPDFTRFHSNSGFITNVYYHALVEMGCRVVGLARDPQKVQRVFGENPGFG